MQKRLKNNLDLFWISLVTLYLEMLLIRWIGVEVRIFAYLSNFVLIACFLGFGIGCFQSNKSFKPWHALLIGLAIVFLVSEPFGVRIIPFKAITQILGGGLADLPIWDTWAMGNQIRRGLMLAVGTVLTILLFGMVVLALIPFGRRIGWLFDQHPYPIEAYSYNVLGSLVGTWLFAGLSFLRTPPWFWFALLMVFTVVYIPRQKGLLALWLLSGLCLVALLLPRHARILKEYWSPYQKLVLSQLDTADGQVQRGYEINVNNTGYQLVLDLSTGFLTRHPEYFNLEEAAHGHYNLPYQFVTNVGRVLIVGAGAGNDCAAALRHGALAVDCVEIDPAIAELGRQYHPEQPYADPRARLIVDDARSYFGKTDKRYDVVWFGLLDSHTQGSAYNNVRLDHYVYTEESFQAARRLLTDQGALVLFFQAEAEWIVKRLYGLLEKVFGHPPLAYHVKTRNDYYGWGGTLFVTGKDLGALESNLSPSVASFLDARRLAVVPDVPLTSDDWPFMYLPAHRIPKLHLLVSACLLLVFLAFRRQILGVAVSFDWRFFCLGGGFLLMEVQSVTKAGLLLGSTWMVNCLIISQVLIWILLSNWVYSKIRFARIGPVLALLLADLLLIYLVPMHVFTQMPYLLRALLGSVHLTLPVFFAGLVFIRLFNATERKDSALGANLMGALAGGLMESGAFLFGQKSLLIPAALFYLAVYVINRWQQPR